VVQPFKAGKGFGTPVEPKKEPSKEKSSTPAVSTPPPQQTSVPVSSTVPPPVPDLNAGQKALAEMRRQKAQQRDAELQKMRQLQQQDQRAQEEAAAAIPEKVAQRMGQRMLTFVGLPLFLWLGSFVGFWYMATYRDLEFQPALVATTTIVLLAVSLLGITYSVMSTSWDEDRVDEDGGLLGVQEFQRNVGNLQDGLARSKENAILRDKMMTSGPPPPSATKKTAMSLQDKLQDELE